MLPPLLLHKSWNNLVFFREVLFAFAPSLLATSKEMELVSLELDMFSTQSSCTTSFRMDSSSVTSPTPGVCLSPSTRMTTLRYSSTSVVTCGLDGSYHYFKNF